MSTKTILFLLVVISGLLVPASVTAQHRIMTVSGDLEEDEMGLTLIHEHFLVDFIGADKTGDHRWDKNEVVKKVLPFLLEAKRHGVMTILECTPAYLGRDPELLKMLSDTSGINIITNTGFYGAVNDKYIPPFAFNIDVDSMAAIWIKEYRGGIGQSGIRPGFIKISVDSDSVLSSIDEKIVRAAIQVHFETGLTIVSHTGPDAPALAQLRLLEEANLSPNAWVWTHAQAGTTEGLIAAARRNAWISIDDISKDNFQERVETLLKLKSAGLIKQILISHDAGWYKPEEPNGGDFRGFTDIFNFLIPALKEHGFEQNEINQMLIYNPFDAFAIRSKK